MKRTTATLVGAGARGWVYLRCSEKYDNGLKIIAIVEPNKVKREAAAKFCNIANDMLFENLDDFFKANIKCDIVVNATMDSAHISTGLAIMENGYDQILEKPITASREELLAFEKAQQKSGTQVFICHVLRYTPFYRNIKKHLLNNDIGKIISITMAEHAGIAHFMSSYLVGNWKSEKECGSSFLLAKSCHDTDIMCWLNNSTEPVSVASFRDRKTFIPENAPEGHGKTCDDCACGDTCRYNVKKINPPEGWVYDHSCLYNDKDLCDRQHAVFLFENGSMGTFNLIGGVTKPDRPIHIVGDAGEIVGSFEDGKYTVRKFDFETYTYHEEHYCVTNEIADAVGFHNGGDDRLWLEIAAFLNGDKSSISITNLKDSINSHLCVYAADESAKTGTIVKIR